MSTHWHVYCLDCKTEHEFLDANHEAAVMALLCKHAAAIAALAPLFEEYSGIGADLELRVFYGRVDPIWFAKHAGHRLVPRNEYGGFLETCDAMFACKCCGSNLYCKLPPSHEGEHAKARP